MNTNQPLQINGHLTFEQVVTLHGATKVTVPRESNFDPFPAEANFAVEQWLANQEDQPRARSRAFEILIACLLSSANRLLHNDPLLPGALHSVRVEFNGTRCELDAVLVRGARLFVGSCTISDDNRELRKKLDEVAYWSERTGGTLARAALFVPHNRRLNSLRTRIELFRFGNRVKVFGAMAINTSINAVVNCQPDRLDRELAGWLG